MQQLHDEGGGGGGPHRRFSRTHSRSRATSGGGWPRGESLRVVRPGCALRRHQLLQRSSTLSLKHPHATLGGLQKVDTASAEVMPHTQQLPVMTISWATLDANLLQLILTPLRASTSLDDRRACGRFRSVCSGWRDVHDQSSTLLRLRTAGGRTFNFRRGRWPNVTTVGGTRPQTLPRAVREGACEACGWTWWSRSHKSRASSQSQTSMRAPSTWEYDVGLVGCAGGELGRGVPWA
jgi:hypothetical protein